MKYFRVSRMNNASFMCQGVSSSWVFFYLSNICVKKQHFYMNIMQVVWDEKYRSDNGYKCDL